MASKNGVQCVAVPNRFCFCHATAGCAVVSAAILSRRQLSTDLLKIYLRWIKRRRGSREPKPSTELASDHGSKAYHSIIESPSTVKTRAFHFWTSRYTHHRIRRVPSWPSETVRKQSCLFFFIFFNDSNSFSVYIRNSFPGFNKLELWASRIRSH